ncbi:MAG: SprT-like domain-containing protein [bacterium]
MSYPLQDFLSKLLNKQVTVTFTENRRIIMRVRHISKDRINLRIHKIFLQADVKIIQAIANFVEKKEASSVKYIKLFFKEQSHLLKETSTFKKGRKTYDNSRLKAQGNFYNLKEIYDYLNKFYFNQQLDIPVIWSKRTNKPRQRSIRLGSFYPNDNLIRIHPKLDNENIPYYVVESIVYHEMVHGYLNKNGYNLNHTRDFKTVEKKYQYFKQANQWIKENKGVLLTQQQFSF